MRWFASEVLPLLRERLGCDIRLRVVGLNKAASITALEGSSLELVGQVRDLEPAFDKARVFVAPTRFAAGIPLKVYQAAALGVPIVTTDLIAEQMDWVNGKDLLAASDPNEFAEACVRLYREKELWQQICDNALARCRDDCSPEKFAEAVRNILAIVPVRAGDKSR